MAEQRDKEARDGCSGSFWDGQVGSRDLQLLYPSFLLVSPSWYIPSLPLSFLVQDVGQIVPSFPSMHLVPLHWQNRPQSQDLIIWRVFFCLHRQLFI